MSIATYDQRVRHDFLLLPADQQVHAIRRFAAMGRGDHAIADITGLHVEQIRRILAEREVSRA